eukprot:Awhi_evm1s8503
MSFAFIDIFFTTIFALTNPWPKENLKDPVDLQEREEAQRKHLLEHPLENNQIEQQAYISPHKNPLYRHGFVVVTHNSSDILAASARAILRHVEPWQLFFCDNGSTEEEERLSDEVCTELTQEYKRAHPYYTGPPINISHIKKGSKTWAQYAAIDHLAKFIKSVEDDSRFNSTAINCVTIMDDDVILPYNWSQEKANREFDKNPLTIAIAYPLKADNPEDSIWARYQDCEYLMGDAERSTQDFLGTNLFCSGAMATWKLGIFQKVLERHDATFHGEDIEMGWITHKLSGRTKLEGVSKNEIVDIKSTQHRVALMRDCVVPTTVPIHFHHYFDYLPVKLGKKMPGGRSCPCGEASLFYQRNRSWDIANHSFFFRFIGLVFSPGGWFSRIKFFVRVVAMWKVVGILREYIFIFGIFLYLAMNRSWIAVLSLICFTGDALVIWWGLYSCVLHIQNLRFRQSYLQCSFDIVVTYPCLFLFNLTSYVRPIAAIYNVLYYWPFESFAPQIKKQLEKDEELRVIVENAWDIEKGIKTFEDVEYEKLLSMQGSEGSDSSNSSVISFPEPALLSINATNAIGNFSNNAEAKANLSQSMTINVNNGQDKADMRAYIENMKNQELAKMDIAQRNSERLNNFESSIDDLALTKMLTEKNEVKNNFSNSKDTLAVLKQFDFDSVVKSKMESVDLHLGEDDRLEQTSYTLPPKALTLAL